MGAAWKVINCVNYGNVTSEAASIGGIAGQATTIENCVNYGNVTGGNGGIGGIVGRVTTVKNCINYGNVRYYSSAGWLSNDGHGGLGGIAATIKGMADNCYAKCILTTFNTSIGGVCYDGEVSSITNCTIEATLNYGGTNFDNIGAIKGYGGSVRNIKISNCCFYGSANFDLKDIVGPLALPKNGGLAEVTNSWMICNNVKTYTSDLSDETWAVVESLGELPVNKNVYWVAEFAPVPPEGSIIEYLKRLGFEEYKQDEVA